MFPAVFVFKSHVENKYTQGKFQKDVILIEESLSNNAYSLF